MHHLALIFSLGGGYFDDAIPVGPTNPAPTVASVADSAPVCVSDPPTIGSYSLFDSLPGANCQCAGNVSFVEPLTTADATVPPCFATFTSTVTTFYGSPCMDFGMGRPGMPLPGSQCPNWNDAHDDLVDRFTACLGPQCHTDARGQTLFLIGDSHVQNFKTAFEIALRGRTHVLAMGSSPCGFRPA